MSALRRIGIVGCGVMGAGIAEVCAKAETDVVVVVSSPASVDRGRNRIAASLDKAVTKGKITDAERDAAVDRIAFTTELERLADRELVVEAVREEESLKLDLIATVDKILDSEDAVLASNTSSLSIARLASVTSRPEQLVGLHFFNPVPVMPLVELIGSVRTSEDALARVEAFVRDALGKTVIRPPDRAGFLVNALLFPFLLNAVRMVESGVADAATVDTAMVLGASHPLGPLRLVDLIGLDTTVAIAEALYAEFRQPLYAPPPLLRRMVESGVLGKKTGLGFFDYA